MATATVAAAAAMIQSVPTPLCSVPHETGRQALGFGWFGSGSGAQTEIQQRQQALERLVEREREGEAAGGFE
jgi:hypothetical protein